MNERILVNKPWGSEYLIYSNKNLILYKPRNKISGSVICHLGEVHLKDKAKGDILNYI